MRTFPKMECIGNGVIVSLTNPPNAEIDDRIRFSKHFVILGNVESLLLDAQMGAGGCNAGVTQ